MQSDGPAETEVVVASASLCQLERASQSPCGAFAKAPSARRLGQVFNLSGSELVFLVLIALVVLGPDKLPEAMRRAGKAYNDFKKMTTGFQSEMRSVLDEPMRELRETADLVKQSAMFDINTPETPSQDITPKLAPALGAAVPAIEPAVEPAVPPDGEPSTIVRPAGPNFSSAAPTTTEQEPPA